MGISPRLWRWQNGSICSVNHPARHRDDVGTSQVSEDEAGDKPQEGEEDRDGQPKWLKPVADPWRLCRVRREKHGRESNSRREVSRGCVDASRVGESISCKTAPSRMTCVTS